MPNNGVSVAAAAVMRKILKAGSMMRIRWMYLERFKKQTNKNPISGAGEFHLPSYLPAYERRVPNGFYISLLDLLNGLFVVP